MTLKIDSHELDRYELRLRLMEDKIIDQKAIINHLVSVIDELKRCNTYGKTKQLSDIADATLQNTPLN
jgi:Na+-transporting NADH:ubiquinone oxidoreductase subunit NqrD